MGSFCCVEGQSNDNPEAQEEAKYNTTTAGNKETHSRTGSKSPYAQMTDNKEDYAEQKLNPDEYVNRLTVYVVQARNLPKYDIGPNAKSDPYVKVRMGKSKNEFRTGTVRRELNPVWNSSFVEERKGLFSEVDNVTFEVFDHDKLSKDDYMGECTIPTDKSPSVHYSTAVTWYPLVDKTNQAVKGQNGKPAEIQIKFKYTVNAEDMNIRYYTHVMEFTVKRGKNIRNKEWIGKSDPYVKMEWGAQSYETRYLNNTTEPVWNESAFIFVHEQYHSKYQLKLCVMDKDINADDQLGTGYVAASQVFDKCKDGKPFNLDVELRAIPVSLDRGLLDFQKNEQFKAWGDLEVEVKLKTKDDIDKEFYEALVKTFDKNNDGVIDKNEVTEMFAELKIPKNVDEFFSKFDENNDMKLDENEVITMLQDSDFQGSALATQLMAIYLRGDLGGDYGKHLMAGFSHKHSSTSKVIKIKDRETGLLVQEFVPSYVWYSLKLIYDVKLNRAMIQSKVAHKILYQMSKKRGTSMDAPKSSSEIPGFIKQHNLDTRSLYKKPEQFKTFNDFFARGMKVEEYRPLAYPDDESVIVSPADCRMMCWDTILDSTKFWIKGSKFTLENLCGPNTKVDIKKYNGGSFVIARLAPQDYHRWHYPIGGKVINVEKIDGALYTVNPIAINKPVDVYTQNKRAIVEIECGGKTGNCIMFVIAATMVGSYKLHRSDAEDPTKNDPIPLQVGDTVQRGAVAGEFRFGGSTILLLFEPNKVKFDDDIIRNVEQKIETLMQVRDRIGRVQ